jgi:hypothetical protein
VEAEVDMLSILVGLFIQGRMGIVLISSAFILLFFLVFVIVQSASIVDVDLDIPSTCHHQWRRLTLVPITMDPTSDE